MYTSQTYCYTKYLLSLYYIPLSGPCSQFPKNSHGTIGAFLLCLFLILMSLLLQIEGSRCTQLGVQQVLIMSQSVESVKSSVSVYYPLIISTPEEKNTSLISLSSLLNSPFTLIPLIIAQQQLIYFKFKYSNREAYINYNCSLGSVSGSRQ